MQAVSHETFSYFLKASLLDINVDACLFVCFHLWYIYYMFCFVKNVWLTNREKSCLFWFLGSYRFLCREGTVIYISGIKQVHLGEVSGKQRIVKKKERERKNLPQQQKNRARTRSRHKERAVRLTDAQDQAFKNPPGASTWKFISNISKMNSSVPSVMALKRRNFCSADVSALDTWRK